jgi:hypothetical protein
MSYFVGLIRLGSFRSGIDDPITVTTRFDLFEKIILILLVPVSVI